MAKENERKMILDMVAEGKISVDESLKLLDALEDDRSIDFKKELDNFTDFVKDTANKLGQKGQEILSRIEKDASKEESQSSVQHSRIEILRMLDEDKITVEEATELLNKIGG